MGFFADVGPLQIFVSSHVSRLNLTGDKIQNSPCDIVFFS